MAEMGNKVQPVEVKKEDKAAKEEAYKKLAAPSANSSKVEAEKTAEK